MIENKYSSNGVNRVIDGNGIHTKTATQLSEQQRLQISDLADGQLNANALAETLTLLDTSEQARMAWHSFHIVGDALRSDELTAIQGDIAFLDRLQKSLKLEAPHATRRNATESVVRVPTKSANDPIFQWKWVVGLSSIAAALVVSWNLVGGIAVTNGSTGALLATQSTPQSATALTALPTRVGADTAVVMLRDPQLDALIAAHRQLGGHSALQTPSGFLQQATFDKVNR